MSDEFKITNKKYRPV